MDYVYCKRNAETAILTRPEYADCVSGEWFNAPYWGERASAIADGGRGSAWFVDNQEQQWVLRHYRRGGLPAKFSARSYFFTGHQRVRAIAEFELLAKLHKLGLPVPTPVAAYYQRRGSMMYEAAIIVERLPATTLENCPRLEDPQLWRQLGQVIASFHRAGLHHIDLNVHNILVSGDRIYLIDLDRCRLRKISTNWQQSNLERLQRSVSKHLSLKDSHRRHLWQQLSSAYQVDLGTDCALPMAY